MKTTAPSSKRHLATILAGCISGLLAVPASAAVVTLNASDAVGTTSFNTAGRWDDGLAPSPGNDYFTAAFQLRSPTGAAAATFLGDSLSINAGGSFLFKGSGVYTINNLILNGGSIIQGDTGVASPNNIGTLAGTIMVAAPSSIDTSTSTNRIITINSVIHGAAGINILGTIGTTGAVNFTNTANDFTGPITFTGSSPLAVPALTDGGVIGALGAATADAANLVFNGGALRVNGAVASSTNRLLTLNGNGTIESAHATAAITFADPSAIVHTGTGARTLTLSGASTGANTFAPVIGDGPGATSLTKAGAGLWNVTGNNSYTGATNVNGGTLVFSSFANLGAGTAINLGGGTLRWATGNTVDITSRTVTLTGGTSGLNTNGQNITLAGSIGGAGALTKSGGGILTLNGANTFTGNVSVGNGGGGIRITNSSSLGSGTKTISVVGNTGGANTPTLRLDGSAGDINLPGSFSFTTSADGLNPGNLVPGIQNEAGNNSINGNFTLTGGGGGTTFQVNGGSLVLNGTLTPNTTGRALILGGVGNGTANGVIQDQNVTNILAVRKEGAGTWVLNGANTYTAATTVNAGTLVTNTASTGGGAVTVAGAGTLGVRLAGIGQSFNTSTLTTAAGSTLALNLRTFGTPITPVINATTFNPSALTNVTFSGTNLTAGTTFPLIDYGTLGGGGFAALNLVLPPRATGNLVDNVGNTSVDLNLLTFDFPRWSGETNNNWGTAGTLNWREVNSGNITAYMQGAVSDGVLFNDSATAPGANNVNLIATLTPSSVTVDNSVLTYTFSGLGKISGTTGLNKTGTGKLILANIGGNDYAGPTTIDFGSTLQLGDGVTVGGDQIGTGAVGNDGTFILNRPTDFALPNNISGSGSLEKQGTNKATLSGVLTYTGVTTISAGTLQIESPTLPGDVLNNGTLILNAPTTLSGAISGGGPLIAQSGGTKVLAGFIANTYTGLTTVTGGALQLSKTGANAVSGDILVDGGSLTWAQPDQVENLASITVTTGSINTTNKADTIANLTINSPTLSTFSGLTINGTLTVTTGVHDAVNSGGTLFTNAAILSGGSNSRLGANSGDSTWSIGTGGLTMNGATITYGNTGGAFNAVINLGGDFSGSGTNSLAVPNNNGPRLLDLQGSTRLFDITGGTTTVTPTVQNGGITKTGAGTLVLNGAVANTITNLTTVSAGLLQFSKTAGVNAVGGDIRIDGTGRLALTTANQIPDTATLTYDSAGTTTTIANDTVANVSVLSGGEASQLILGGTFVITGQLAVSGGLVAIASNATVTAGSANLTGGIVRIAANSNPSTLNVLGSFNAANVEVQVGQGVGNNNAVINLGGDYTGNGAVVFNRGGYTGPNKRELNLGGGLRTFDVQSGETIINADLANGSVLKTGVGTLTLNGQQGYPALTASDGVTNINANALNADITANAAVNFGASQTLNSLVIGDGATVTLVETTPPAPAPAFAGLVDDSGAILAGGGVQAVPEPATASLLLLGALGLLARRRKV